MIDFDKEATDTIDDNGYIAWRKVAVLGKSIAARVERETIERCYLELQMRGSSYAHRIGSISLLYSPSTQRRRNEP